MSIDWKPIEELTKNELKGSINKHILLYKDNHFKVSSIGFKEKYQNSFYYFISGSCCEYYQHIKDRYSHYALLTPPERS